MTEAAGHGEALAALAERVRAQLGVVVRGTRVPVLARALAQRVMARGLPSPEDYVARLDVDAAFRAEEAAALGDALAVLETHFFRQADQLHAFVREALPARVAARARAGERRLELLSAGCATGEEAYSLAILLREEGARLAGWELRVTAVDVSERALERARAGRYEAWAFRTTPPALRARHFVERGGRAEVRPELRALVAFERRNLLDDDPRFWRRGRFDAIFCRNVFIYFSQDAVGRVLGRFAHALAPGGRLFLGHADSVRGLESPFALEPLEAAGAFAYRLRDEAPRERAPAGTPVPRATPAPVLTPPPRTPAPVGAAPAAAGVPGAGPVAAGERPDVAGLRGDAPSRAAGARATAPPSTSTTPSLTAAPSTSTPRTGGAAEPPRATRLTPDAHARVLALLARERFAEALALLPPEPAADDEAPEVALLRVVLLESAGRRDASARVLDGLLEAHPGLSEAHYLAGLARDCEGDRLGALAHYEHAARLDPAFALPWLQLGLVRRVAGDAAGAHEALAHAARLLPGEAGWRLQLFGGGFTREALLAVCGPPDGEAP